MGGHPQRLVHLIDERLPLGEVLLNNAKREIEAIFIIELKYFLESLHVHDVAARCLRRPLDLRCISPNTDLQMIHTPALS